MNDLGNLVEVFLAGAVLRFFGRRLAFQNGYWDVRWERNLKIIYVGDSFSDALEALMKGK